MDLWMQAGIAATRILGTAAVGPGLPFPARLLAHRDEVEQFSARNEVVDEVPAGSHPIGRVAAHPEMRNPLCRRQTAIGDIAGETRALLAEENAADRRVNPVGADEDVALDVRSVLECGADAAVSLGRAYATPPRLQHARRERAAQHGQQVGAMDMVVRRAILWLDRIAQLLGRGGRGVPPAADL